MRRTMATFLAAALGLILIPSAASAQSPNNGFREIAQDEIGGHFFSQVIYAPTIKGVVSWGTRTHAKPIRAYETQHLDVGQNRWSDAFPKGKGDSWSGKLKSWAGWGICAPVGQWYEWDGVRLPRPNSSFYQVCWDGHNKRLVYYLGSMTYAYDPAAREWKLIHGPQEESQPPPLLIWGSLCYDPLNKRILLFGGGGVDVPDGRPHTWSMDVTTNRWRKLKLDVEPPARCNSRLVYDAEHQLIVLFGGDGQDRGLADTWVFDVRKKKWEQRKPLRSPHPRSCHAMAYLEKSKVVLMVGGVAVADYRQQKQLSEQAWIYDAGENVWTPLDVQVPAAGWMSMENIPGTDEVIVVTASKYDHRRVTYRFQYDASLKATGIPGVGKGGLGGVAPSTVVLKTKRTKSWYEQVPPADQNKHARFLKTLPANTWVEAKPPRSTPGRTWGTSMFDTERGIAMKWGGGHSGYQGTDMAFYDVAANRFSIDRTPAFTPEPFGRWHRRPAGRTFFNQPWTYHQRHTCAYDSVAQLGVFTHTGSPFSYSRDQLVFLPPQQRQWRTWLYDPVRRKWLEPIAQPFPGGLSISPIAIATGKGVWVWQRGEMWRFVGSPGKTPAGRWEQVEVNGDDRPRQHEFMTIVYDSRRDRFIFLSADTDRNPQLWFFGLKERRWVKNPTPAGGGVSTREAVYLPDADAILAYGPATKDDDVWTRAYLCGENRWISLDIKTPQYTVHEVGLEYDPIHKLAVLLWPPRFEQPIRPHLLRFDASKLPKR